MSRLSSFKGAKNPTDFQVDRVWKSVNIPNCCEENLFKKWKGQSRSQLTQDNHLKSKSEYMRVNVKTPQMKFHKTMVTDQPRTVVSIDVDPLTGVLTG